MFVIDTSGSVGEDNFELVREFVLKLIQLADLEAGHVRLAALSFATRVNDLFDFNDYLTSNDGIDIQDRKEIENTIKNMTYTMGKTNTAAAITEAYQTYFTESGGARTDVPRRLLVITDGESTIEPEKTIPAATNAKNHNIEIFAIGIGMPEPEQREELMGIASDPPGLNVLQLTDFDELDYMYKKIFRLFCRSK